MYYERSLFKQKAEKYLEKYPILCILGPRQCGKSTFVKSLRPEYEYYDLEKPSDEEILSHDIELFLKNLGENVIIDEAQRAPELFKALRSYVDSRNQKGQFILLGSASFELLTSISESLAGRVGFIDMTPFHVSEVRDLPNKSRHWLKGGFPDAFLTKSKNLEFDWFENYTRSLIERDLPSLGINFDSSNFRKFWKMLVSGNACILNKNQYATSMGISAHTIENYINILEQSFLVRRLPPYSGNIKKRLIKSPKLYIRDSGVLHYFHRLESSGELNTSRFRGSSFESYVVEQVITYLNINKPSYEVFYFRSSDGLEIDLLVTKGEKILPIEIKSKSTLKSGDYKNIILARKYLNFSKAFILYEGERRYECSEEIWALPFKELNFEEIEL